MTISLAIDARPLARGTGGIQRYLRSLLPHIVEIGVFDIVLYCDQPVQTSFLGTSVRIRHLAGNFSSAISWHAVVCLWAALDKPDIYWSPRHHLPLYLPKKTVQIVTIHDFVWRTWPETVPRLQLLAEKLLMPFSLKKADKIVVISETTRSQLRQFFPIYLHKSTAILHGVDETLIPKYSHCVKRRDFFLAVGTLEPRKNYERLIRAFDMYAEEGGSKDLTIVGKKGWGYSTILECLTKSKNKARIKIKSSVTDVELSELYSRACGFLSPSLDEGYGLPPQEASQYGLPMLLSDIDVYRELYGHADFWVCPLSVTDMAAGLKELEKKPIKRAIGLPDGRYNWQDCAKKHIDFFAQTIEKPAQPSEPPNVNL